MATSPNSKQYNNVSVYPNICSHKLERRVKEYGGLCTTLRARSRSNAPWLKANRDVFISTLLVACLLNVPNK